MDEAARESEARFAVYADSLAGVLGHADHVGPLMDYCTGLLMPGERKSVEPIAAIVAPARAAAEHQSLFHFVGQSAWSDEAMLAKVRELIAPAFETQGGRRSLDRRRHGISEEGLALGGCGAAILRAVGQDRQLPDRGDAHAHAETQGSVPGDPRAAGGRRSVAELSHQEQGRAFRAQRQGIRNRRRWLAGDRTSRDLWRSRRRQSHALTTNVRQECVLALSCNECQQ